MTAPPSEATARDQSRGHRRCSPCLRTNVTALARDWRSRELDVLPRALTSRRARSGRATTASALAAVLASLCLCHDRDRAARATVAIALTLRPAAARHRNGDRGVAQSGGRRRLSLGDSASHELLGAAEIRTPAFRRSARARGIVRPWRRPRCRRMGCARASTRYQEPCRADADCCIRAMRRHVGHDPTHRRGLRPRLRARALASASKHSSGTFAAVLQVCGESGGHRTGAALALDDARDIHARGGGELHEDVAQVRLDGLLAEEELGRDLAVGHAVGHELGDLALAR